MEKYLKTDRSVPSKAKRWINGFLPRKFHCFGLGAEKTGTTSLSAMLENTYRSGHEVDPQKTIQMIIDYQKEKISNDQISTILKKRDKVLNLEMESAHHLVYICDVLVETFPKAKFIITIREPYSQLSSRLNWHKTPNKPAWDNYVEYFLEKQHTGYEKEELPLKKYNLYSLDTFLKQYSDHYKRVFDNIPQEKRIIIKTSDLNNSMGEIASFLNIGKNSIQIAHSKKSVTKVKIIEELDQSFVRNKIWANCSDIIQEFFPETVHLYKN